MGLKALAHAVLERNQLGNFGGVNQAKKFPLKLTYVACMDCANLQDGYCSEWNHYPDVPEIECRLCKQFVKRGLEIQS